MATLSYGGVSYTVNHAVKGADFIHGYDANNALVVSFEGVTNFSGFTYTGTYMAPADCLDEGCNDVKFHGGSLKKADGTTLAPGDYGAQPVGSYAGKSSVVTATLAAANWSGSAAPYTYALTVSGVTATSNQEILPALNITAAQLEALQAANIQDGGQATNTITLKAYGDKPTVNLPIRVVKRGDA